VSDWTLHTGDCLEVLPTLPDASVDTVISDPPAGINFMQLEFDSDRGGRLKWVEWLASVLRECLRVAKPGATAAVWALPRTSHWTGCALEEAGWEIFDVVTHLFGAGMPKGCDVGKAIDRAAGAEREVVGEKVYADGHVQRSNGTDLGRMNDDAWRPTDGRTVTAPATDAARLWDGWHSGLKPAAEFWWLARKPLDGTYACNALEHGVAGLNVDGTRIPTPDCYNCAPASSGYSGMSGYVRGTGRQSADRGGRYPANVVLSHHPSCVRRGTRRVKGITGGTGNHPGNVYGTRSREGEPVKDYADADGMETVEDWVCHEDCPVRLLDEQAGERKSGHLKKHAGDPVNDRWREWEGRTDERFRTADYEHAADSGGPSRFFTRMHYCGKASRRERGEGNNFPCVKPLSLMRWLCRLTKTPTGGVVLDPFAGSGTTLLAALLEGRRAIGIEKDPGYAETARKRLAGAQGPLFAHAEGNS
jgi:DNA modification methylase